MIEKYKALEAENERLKGINSALCTKSNSYLIQNARLEEERDELTRQLAELTEWNNQIGRTNYELRKQLEGEKAAALNYRADALDAERQLAELKGGLTYRNSLVCHLEKQLAEYKADAAMKGATE